jgi:hypothetical protein
MKLVPKRFVSRNSKPNTSFWLRDSTSAIRRAAVCALPLEANFWFTPAICS